MMLLLQDFIALVANTHVNIVFTFHHGNSTLLGYAASCAFNCLAVSAAQDTHNCSTHRPGATHLDARLDLDDAFE